MEKDNREIIEVLKDIHNKLDSMTTLLESKQSAYCDGCYVYKCVLQELNSAIRRIDVVRENDKLDRILAEISSLRKAYVDSEIADLQMKIGGF